MHKLTQFKNAWTIIAGYFTAKVYPGEKENAF